MNEVIDINLTKPPSLTTANAGDVGTIKLNNLPALDANSTKKSVNFGPGIEMLMNEKRRSSSPKSDIKLADLESLDNTLNLQEKPTTSGISRKDATTAMFNKVSNQSTPAASVLTQEIKGVNLSVSEISSAGIGAGVGVAPAVSPNINLGQATAKSEEKEKTWDGFKKFNEIPVDPTKPVPMTPKMSNEDIIERKNLFILRKLRSS